MTTDMMTDATVPNAPGPGEPDADEGGDMKQAVEEKITAYLPMEVFGENTPEIGKVCSFKVVDVAEDGQVEVEYAHSEEMPPSAGDRPKAPWDEADADEMMETM